MSWFRQQRLPRCAARQIKLRTMVARPVQNRTGQDRIGVGAWLGKHMVSEFDGQQLCEFAFDSHKYALKLIRKWHEYNALLLISYPSAVTPPLRILFPSHIIPFPIILLARLNFIHIIHKMLFNLQPCLIKLPICSAKQCEQCASVQLCVCACQSNSVAQRCVACSRHVAQICARFFSVSFCFCALHLKSVACFAAAAEKANEIFN